MPVSIAALLVPIKSALSDKATGMVVDSLVDQVVGTHREQMEVLNRIEQKVDNLLTGPFRAGETWLEAAGNDDCSPPDRLVYLNHALNKFVDAESQLEGYERVLARTHVALVHGLLGHRSEFERWVIRARGYAHEQIAAALARAQRVHAGFLPSLFDRDKSASARLLWTLKRYIPAVSDLDAVIGDSPIAWSYEIVETEVEGRDFVSYDQSPPGWSTSTEKSLIVYRDGVPAARLMSP